MIGVFCLDCETADRAVRVIKRRNNRRCEVLPIVHYTPAILARYSIIVKIECGHADCELSESIAFGEIDEIVAAAAAGGDCVKCTRVSHPMTSQMLCLRLASAKFELIEMQTRFCVKFREYLGSGDLDAFTAHAAVLATQARHSRAPTCERINMAIAPVMHKFDAIAHLYVNLIITKQTGDDVDDAIISLPGDKMRVLKCYVLAIRGSRRHIHFMVRNYNIHGYDKSLPPAALQDAMGHCLHEEEIVTKYYERRAPKYGGFWSLTRSFNTSIASYCALAGRSTAELIGMVTSFEYILDDVGVSRDNFIDVLTGRPDLGPFQRLEIITALL